MPTKPPEPGEIRQIVVHDAVWKHLEAWLSTRNIDLCPLPLDGDDLPLDGDDLPTYVMQPRLAPAPPAPEEAP